MAEKKEWKDMSKSDKIIGSVGLGIIVLVIVLVINSMFRQSDQPEEPPKPTNYEYEVLSYHAIDPATLRFSIELTNPNDGVWEKPACSVTFENETGKYRGWDTFSLGEPIPGKSSKTMNGVLTISKEGANHVTKHTVRCE